MESIQEKLSVIATVNAVVNTADRQDWQACQALFAPLVTLDHDAHQPSASVAMTPEQITQSWQKAFSKMRFTWHQVTNHEVEIQGKRAICTCKVMGLHVGKDGKDHYTTFGNYRHQLLHTQGGWKITSLQYTQLHQEGNPHLFTH